MLACLPALAVSEVRIWLSCGCAAPVMGRWRTEIVVKLNHFARLLRRRATPSQPAFEYRLRVPVGRRHPEAPHGVLIEVELD